MRTIRYTMSCGHDKTLPSFPVSGLIFCAQCAKYKRIVAAEIIADTKVES